MAHKFIVNTNNVNEYGYRVLTEGIDYKQYLKNPVVLYQHERFTNDFKGSEVIGRCLALHVVDDKLIADIEFDQADPYAKKIEGKVERGYVRMASMYADVKATSTNPADILPGQTLETVTQCKLVEISIVDIGGNDAALKLSRNGAPIQLQKIQQNPKHMSFKTIALALGLNADASEDVILNTISEVKLAKKTAEENVQQLQNEVETSQTADATALLDKAIKLNLMPAALKDAQLAAFKADFATQKVTLSKLIADKETENAKTNKAKLVKELLAGATSRTDTGAEGYQKGDFVKLSKENPAELMRLRRDDPEEFKALYAAQYGAEPNL